MRDIFAEKPCSDTNPEPFVPSHALVLVQFGTPYIIYHQGTELDYWIEDVCGSTEAALEMLNDRYPDGIPDDVPDGVFVWSGFIQSSQDYWGEHDSYLTGDETHPVTQEEWRAFVADEIIWDFDQMRARLDWEFERRMEDPLVNKVEETKVESVVVNDDEDNQTPIENLEEILNLLATASDDMLATPLSVECRDFGKFKHTFEEKIRFLRDLRDKCVYVGGASSLVMHVFSAILDGVPESDADRDARHIELKKWAGLR